MKQWNRNIKPQIDICPEHYCICWVPPKGKADFSGKLYDSFEEAKNAIYKGPIFLHGCCASPIKPCKRETKNSKRIGSYEPCNPILTKQIYLSYSSATRIH